MMMIMMMMMMMHGLTYLKYQYQSNLDLFLLMLTERFKNFVTKKYAISGNNTLSTLNRLLHEEWAEPPEKIKFPNS
jgi:hypothetical protein